MTEISCLLDHLDIEASHLFCHSTGCGLGISWASSRPPRVKTLTLVNPWNYADEQLTTLQRLRIDAAKQLSPYFYTHFNSTILFPAYYKAEYTEAFEAKAIAAKRFPHNALQIERRLNSILNFDARTFTHKVTSPCLLITSKDDILMPPWHADNLTKEIKNATKYCLNFGGHMLPETRSKKISQLTRNFLLEHSQG
jgi:aminoacrylate hydrolase